MRVKMLEGNNATIGVPASSSDARVDAVPYSLDLKFADLWERLIGRLSRDQAPT
jgi:hypothetical protein